MSLDALMKDLQKDYLAGLPEKIINLETLIEQGDWRALQGEFHKMKGTGKTYGIPELSLIAEMTEAKLNEENVGKVGAMALSLIQKTKKLRSEGKALDLESSPEYQALTKA